MFNNSLCGSLGFNCKLKNEKANEGCMKDNFIVNMTLQFATDELLNIFTEFQTNKLPKGSTRTMIKMLMTKFKPKKLCLELTKGFI